MDHFATLPSEIFLQITTLDYPYCLVYVNVDKTWHNNLFPFINNCFMTNPCNIFIINGHLSILQYIIKKYPNTLDFDICYKAIENNQVDIFKWLMQNHFNNIDNTNQLSLFNNAFDNIEICEFILDYFTLKIDINPFVWADIIDTDNMPLLMLYYYRGTMRHIYFAFDYSAEYNKLKFMKWISSKFYIEKSESGYLYEYAIDNENIIMLQWLKDENFEYDCGKCINHAQSQNNQAIMQWISENITRQISKN